MNDRLVVRPEVCSTDPDARFEYLWTISAQGRLGDTLTLDKVLDTLVNWEPNQNYTLVLAVTNMNSGYTVYQEAELIVGTPYSRGWYVLKDDGQQTDIDLYSEQGKLSNILFAVNGQNLKGKAQKLSFIASHQVFDEEQNKEDLFGEMLEHLTNEVLCKSFLIEFRNLENPLFGYKAFRKNNYFAINWLRVRNSLHSKAPYERLSMSRRRQINKALRNGAIMEIADNEKDIQDFSRMLKKAYSSQVRKHFPDIGFFRLLAWQNPEKELAKVFLVKYKGKIIGGSICLFSKESAYLWFSGGMRKTYAFLYPGILAVWAPITYAHEKGYAHLEFMDAGLPFKKHGYRDFILRFGGKQSSTRRWFRFSWKWLNKLLCKFYI